MPQLGETVTEGTILRWAKTVGEPVVEDEVLLEISTDKVDTEVPSPASGTVLEILVQEGDTVSVGTPLVVIGDEGESSGGAAPSEDAQEAPAQQPESVESEQVESEQEPEASPEPSPEPVVEAQPEAEPESQAASEPAPAATGGDEGDVSSADVEAFFAKPDETDGKPHLLSPVVRKLIRDNELDPTRIAGTGQGGRITRRDVEAYMINAPAAPAEKPAAPAAAAVAEQPTEEPVAPPPPAPTAEAPRVAAPAKLGETVDLDRIRVRVAENMMKSLQTAAHVWTSVEVDFERVERVRRAHREGFKADEGFSLTYLPFISRATIDALKAFPVVNSSLDLEAKTATFHRNVDLGIAIDLDQGGLVVARVRNADGLRLVGIARSIRDLAEKGRSGKLGLDDLTGSTFTITNPGPFGSFMSAPIINVPNVAILSTDTVTKRPTVITTADGQDMIAVRHIGYLGLTWDHRAFDGSTAVLFLRRIKENLETWDWEQELA
jgi:2-oxoglutarate dehydrogenase E2 component (dihydrolipoamide succinyltransferase)